MLNTEHVLVTGAAGDIGSAIVAHFVACGATVTAVDVKSKADILARFDMTQRKSILPASVDLCDRAAVAEVIDTSPPLTAVVGNAGIGGTAKFVDIDDDFWQRTLDVNLTANFVVGQLAARQFIANGVSGRIVFTGSWVGSVPWPEITAYSVSKAGLEMLAK